MAFGFEREGVRVSTAASNDEALAQLQAERPEVVVVTLRQSPEASRFVLEGLSTGSRLPVVALGSEEHRRASVNQPNVDFLPVPAYLRDVITATRLRAATRRDGKEPTVQGALSEYGLFFLLRTLLTLKQSAVVQMERANRKGEMKICKGELRTAQVGTITGAPALNQLLLWEEAALDVRFKAVTARGQFNSKGPALMEDVERFLRDFAHTARALGSAQTVYEPVPSPAVEVASEVAPVLRLFDGQRSISDVLDESPFRVFDTLKIIARFVDTQTIRRKEGVESRPAVSTSAASPLMESWLKGESDRERIDAAVLAAAHIEALSQAPVAAAPVQATVPTVPTVQNAPPAVSYQSGSTGPLPSPASPIAPVANGTVTMAAAATAVGKRPEVAEAGRVTRGEMLAKSSPEDKAVKPRPSMVIDLPPEYLEEMAALEAAAPARPQMAATTTPGPVAAARPDPAAAPINVIAAPAPRTTGLLEIPTAPRAAKTAASRPTGSIELDPSLMAELEPPAPAPVAAPPVMANPRGTPIPLAASANAPVAARSKTGPQSNPFAAKTRTGEFDALEKDFFDREKDLYKPDKPDSFDDL